MLEKLFSCKLTNWLSKPISSPKLVKKKLAITLQNLGNENIETSLAAIDTLEKISQDYLQYYWEVIKNLSVFVRNNTIFLDKVEIESNPSSKIRADIQAALSVIGRRDATKDPKSQQIDLSYTDIRGVNLHNANLKGVNLYQANLSEANLVDANLQESVLSAANLSGANLSGANLSRAILNAANLRAANLTGANLTEANLFLANLHGTNLDRANLAGTNLRDTNIY
ncbi:pentapeptide repeat-containing protein [Chlorogloeopsis sp. ULAP01]|uniref:pentapeptide repeat-containing protein n=1 Tax=Chlorogloeopsis sp. ULAP01 TaxID=3056483 RepID=UPI0025AA6C51|nr:pentapeptide repeat-containing protein [Chlorogloeopsis sp. ULAP01]MDM9380622.1 pentapeptide repeat-containing protein [Chlorogloeopsis sp. ULAP01]